jgi:hypothetical protein
MQQTRPCMKVVYNTTGTLIMDLCTKLGFISTPLIMFQLRCTSDWSHFAHIAGLYLDIT